MGRCRSSTTYYVQYISTNIYVIDTKVIHRIYITDRHVALFMLALLPVQRREHEEENVHCDALFHVVSGLRSRSRGTRIYAAKVCGNLSMAVDRTGRVHPAGVPQ